MHTDFKKQIITWRRDFHRYPETGFLEMRTASIVAGILDELGFSLQLGKQVMSIADCMGKPDEQMTNNHVKWALDHGANLNYIDHFKEGYTGIVAIMHTQRPGPVTAYRFDMDALPIHESEDSDHFPLQQGFRSKVAQTMHACGHDTHTAIGLGLAVMIAANKDALCGTIKLIFQPAEEGTRGAKSMVKAGVVDDVDYFIASHIGMDVPYRQFVAANNGFMATSKLDITFHGIASHAGSKPEEGKNALLAAATTTLQMYAIPRHSAGASRVNVGELHAGSGRNIIASKAKLITEIRGENTNVNHYMKEQVASIVAGVAHMYQVKYDIEVVGEGLNCNCSTELAVRMEQCAKQHPHINKTILKSNDSAGSEDATYFMEAIQKNGGHATYCIFGTELAAGHHHEKFDVNEETLVPAAEILYQSLATLCQKNL